MKLFPGVTLNFSKTGISTTVGVPGASVNFNKQGTYLNTGIPGTGIYDRKRIGAKKKNAKNIQHQFENSPKPAIDHVEEIDKINTKNIKETTSEGLKELHNLLLDSHQEKAELKTEIANAKNRLLLSKFLFLISRILILGFFISWFKENKKERGVELLDIEKQYNECAVNIDIKTEESIEQAYKSLLEAYQSMLGSEKIWDIVAQNQIDQVAARSASSATISRNEIKLGFSNLDIIRSKYDALHFENANGGDLYFYPAFLAIVDGSNKFGLIDIKEVNLEFKAQQVEEHSAIPSDATQHSSTWLKVNKDGSRDKRFKDNYQIPICLYGIIELTSKTGLREAYCFSNLKKAEHFSKAFESYQKLL